MLFCCARILENTLLKRVIPHYNFAIGSLQGIVLMPRIRPAGSYRLPVPRIVCASLPILKQPGLTERCFIMLRVFCETLFMYIETVVSLIR